MWRLIIPLLLKMASKIQIDLQYYLFIYLFLRTLKNFGSYSAGSSLRDQLREPD